MMSSTKNPRAFIECKEPSRRDESDITVSDVTHAPGDTGRLQGRYANHYIAIAITSIQCKSKE